MPIWRIRYVLSGYFMPRWRIRYGFNRELSCPDGASDMFYIGNSHAQMAHPIRFIGNSRPDGASDTLIGILLLQSFNSILCHAHMALNSVKLNKMPVRQISMFFSARPANYSFSTGEKITCQFLATFCFL